MVTFYCCKLLLRLASQWRKLLTVVSCLLTFYKTVLPALEGMCSALMLTLIEFCMVVLSNEKGHMLSANKKGGWLHCKTEGDCGQEYYMYLVLIKLHNYVL